MDPKKVAGPKEGESDGDPTSEGVRAGAARVARSTCHGCGLSEQLTVARQGVAALNLSGGTYTCGDLCSSTSFRFELCYPYSIIQVVM
jgi:hypothetical protein